MSDAEFHNFKAGAQLMLGLVNLRDFYTAIGLPEEATKTRERMDADMRTREEMTSLYLFAAASQRDCADMLEAHDATPSISYADHLRKVREARYGKDEE